MKGQKDLMRQVDNGPEKRFMCREKFPVLFVLRYLGSATAGHFDKSTLCSKYGEPANKQLHLLRSYLECVLIL